ncbi:helix-turn-helix domain-containing protein [Amycolatopsis nalaikhensis]|uniref:Helix-turn-helix domain-containing protein n=1 Tax=Amycolatopsis nalaikhensis TaxID=715472 RepID=A0ABY8XDM6_9PSEU|nr:hypothetical protein [Amycolatopsis sp. 2-2]WIV52892.1 hypothetical protein QP939_28525 [Amycolatopsis sp. 2-2]
MNEAGGHRLPRRRTRRTQDVPAAEAAELKRRYEAGETLLSILEDFDGSYRILRNVLKAQGVTFRAARTVEPSAPPGMAEMYTSGKSLTETGRKFGFSRAVTRRMLTEDGIPIRPRGRPAKEAEDDTRSTDP